MFIKQTANPNTFVEAHKVPNKKHQSKNSTIVRYAYDCSSDLSTHFQKQEIIFDRISTIIQMTIMQMITITKGVKNLKILFSQTNVSSFSTNGFQQVRTHSETSSSR